MNYRANPVYADTLEKLVREYPKAKENAREMFLLFERFLNHEDELSDAFCFDFEATDHRYMEERLNE